MIGGCIFPFSWMVEWYEWLNTKCFTVILSFIEGDFYIDSNDVFIFYVFIFYVCHNGRGAAKKNQNRIYGAEEQDKRIEKKEAYWGIETNRYQNEQSLSHVFWFIYNRYIWKWFINHKRKTLAHFHSTCDVWTVICSTCENYDIFSMAYSPRSSEQIRAHALNPKRLKTMLAKFKVYTITVPLHSRIRLKSFLIMNFR